MKNFRFCFLLIALGMNSGCYYLKSAYHQIGLLTSAQNLDETLASDQLSATEKQKLMLVKKVKDFATTDLGLTANKNYTTYVQLNRPYVTYVVSAAPKWKLEHYLWSFPIIGSAPYKGFFNESEAQDEARSLEKENFDTYVRGVSAYSTLGWFKDPVLSSMLRYKDHDLVNTIIHESVHATLYIKNSADFNERLASFLGNKGTELFYLKLEGESSETLKLIRLENQDEKLFSDFISKELKDLGVWYSEQKNNNETERESRLQQIQQRFMNEIKPQLKTNTLTYFEKIKLNNARLNVYKTYLEDQSHFKQAYENSANDFQKFIHKCKSLENSKDPLKDLQSM